MGLFQNPRLCPPAWSHFLPSQFSFLLPSDASVCLSFQADNELLQDAKEPFLLQRKIAKDACRFQHRQFACISHTKNREFDWVCLRSGEKLYMTPDPVFKCAKNWETGLLTLCWMYCIWGLKQNSSWFGSFAPLSNILFLQSLKCLFCGLCWVLKDKSSSRWQRQGKNEIK